MKNASYYSIKKQGPRLASRKCEMAEQILRNFVFGDDFSKAEICEMIKQHKPQ
jgi:hypothetical protein